MAGGGGKIWAFCLPNPGSAITRASRSSPDAASVVLADLDTGQILFGENPDRQVPIASVTKIMTALLVLERDNPSDVVTVAPEAVPPQDRRGLSELGLVAGERLTVAKLLRGMLLASANDAAVAWSTRSVQLPLRRSSTSSTRPWRSSARRW